MDRNKEIHKTMSVQEKKNILSYQINILILN